MSVTRLLSSRAAAVATLAVVLLVASLASQSGAADSKDFRVINTPAEAVPVEAQGVTDVAGTVGIDQGQNRVSLETPERFVWSGESPVHLGGSSCSGPPVDFPAGIPVALEQVFVDIDSATPDDDPRAGLILLIVDDEGGTDELEIPIPLDSPNGHGLAAGVLDLDSLIVTGGGNQEGDIKSVRLCLNKGTSSDPMGHADVLVIGTILG